MTLAALDRGRGWKQTIPAPQLSAVPTSERLIGMQSEIDAPLKAPPGAVRAGLTTTRTKAAILVPLGWAVTLPWAASMAREDGLAGDPTRIVLNTLAGSLGLIAISWAILWFNRRRPHAFRWAAFWLALLALLAWRGHA